MPIPTPPADRTLDVFEVIEEEYAHLHPGATPAAEGWHFTAGQVRDAASMARIFCEAFDHRDRAWERSPAHDAALCVLDGATALAASAQALHASLDPGGPSAGVDSRRQEFVADLVARLNALIDGPLLAGKEFVALYREAGVSRADDSPGRRSRANRLLLQSAFSPSIVRLRDVRLAAIYDQIRHQGHTALCLSGGGIRSATFALGVLTGLARHQLLGKFDYLSTVSGGGYIGSWLSAWMKHEGAPAVQAQLGSMTGEKLQPDPEPVRHLRAYSSYLAPSLGMLSADTWTLVATMIRNLLLNWVVVVPLMLAALLLPRLAVSILRIGADGGHSILFRVDDEHLYWALYVMGFVLGMAAIMHVHRNRPNEFRLPPPLSQRTQQAFLARCLVPLVLSASALTLAWWLAEEIDRASGGGGLLPQFQTLQWFALGGLAMHVLGWIAGVRRLKRRGLELFVVAGTGAIGGLLSATLVDLVHSVAQHKLLTDLVPEAGILAPRIYVTLAVPAFLSLILIGSQLTVGLTSQRTTDDEREWGARFNAWLFIVIVGWLTLTVILLLLPPLIERSFTWDGPSLFGVSGVSGLITLILGRSAATPASATPATAAPPGAVAVAKRIALALAAPVFAVSLVALLSVVNGQVVLPYACDVVGWCNLPPEGTLHPADYVHPGLIAGVMVMLAALGLGLGLLIDTNQFSLHAMYRNRLTRAYLRASRPRDARAADPFTGFDKGDDLPIGCLWPAEASPAERTRDRDERMPPLHVVNMTLNLVSHKALAWQQRQAASLGASALHAGSAFVGYRRTSVPRGARPPADAPWPLYGGPGGLSLGTAVTISGAAASPEAGYNSSPAVTFLMALFNARLGWWLGNPGSPGDRTFHQPCPSIGVVPLLREMFGLATDTSDFVFLSDGGHFENLGLYEMVLRRCRFILVSDGGCDPTASFEDLGNALRKIRIDLGVPIEFPTRMPIFARDAGAGTAGTYWAIGKIRYSQIDRPVGDPAPDADYDGVLVYVKPAIYGHEPADVDNYARMSPAFPHESTADQFFTESQFESYRALGSYVVDQMCADLAGDGSRGGNPSTERPLGWLAARR